MSYDPSVHHRRSIRIKGYDYTQNGAYFITVCTYRHRPLFGKIKQGEMICNPFGDIVVDEWLKTGLLRSYVLIDEWVVMPNHFHGILFYERVIRQEEEYQNIVAYIRNNPVKWEEDELYIR